MKETNPFYGSSAWKACRQQALDRDMGCCVRCRELGRTARDRMGRRVPVLATTVHHVLHLEDRPDLALCLDNLQSLCDRCHDEVHPEKHNGKSAGAVAFEVSQAEKMGIRVEKL